MARSKKDETLTRLRLAKGSASGTGKRMIRPIAHALQKIGFGKRVSDIAGYIGPVRVIGESVHHQMRVEYSAACLPRGTLRFQ